MNIEISSFEKKLHNWRVETHFSISSHIITKNIPSSLPSAVKYVGCWLEPEVSQPAILMQ